jgi:ornithine carbamoyltransferase
MAQVPHPLGGRQLDSLTPVEESAVVEQARRLRGAPATLTRSLLRGKHLCLLSEPPGADAARLFKEAAQGLGSHVAHVSPGLSPDSDPHVLSDTARMLGRLYDGIGCHGLPVEMLARIGAEAGVPVYEVLSSADHRTGELADRLGGSDDYANRLAIVRAMLLRTLSEARP